MIALAPLQLSRSRSDRETNMDWLQSLCSAGVGALLTSGVLKLFFDRWLTASLNRILKEREITGRAELEYRQKQIEEFYGPIYSYLEANRAIYPLWLNGQLTEVNFDVIKMFAAQNDSIIDIIAHKAHLIDGDVMPDELTAFTTSATIWNMYCTRPDTPYLPDHVASLPEVQWPDQFEVYVRTKTIELKRRLNELYQKYHIR